MCSYTWSGGNNEAVMLSKIQNDAESAVIELMILHAKHAKTVSVYKCWYCH